MVNEVNIQLNQTPTTIIAETPPYFFIIIGILLSTLCMGLINFLKSHKNDYPSEQFLNTYLFLSIICFLSSSVITFFDIWLFKRQDIIFWGVESSIAAGFFCLLIAFILFCYHKIKKGAIGKFIESLK